MSWPWFFNIFKTLPFDGSLSSILLVQLLEERLTKRLFNWDSHCIIFYFWLRLHFIFRDNLQCKINTVKNSERSIRNNAWRRFWIRQNLRNYGQIKSIRRERSLCVHLKTGTTGNWGRQTKRYSWRAGLLRMCSDVRNLICSVLFEKVHLKNPDLFQLPESDCCCLVSGH